MLSSGHSILQVFSASRSVESLSKEIYTQAPYTALPPLATSETWARFKKASERKVFAECCSVIQYDSRQSLTMDTLIDLEGCGYASVGLQLWQFMLWQTANSIKRPPAHEYIMPDSRPWPKKQAEHKLSNPKTWTYGNVDSINRLCSTFNLCCMWNRSGLLTRINPCFELWYSSGSMPPMPCSWQFAQSSWTWNLDEKFQCIWQYLKVLERLAESTSDLLG